MLCPIYIFNHKDMKSKNCRIQQLTIPIIFNFVYISAFKLMISQRYNHQPIENKLIKSARLINLSHFPLKSCFYQSFIVAKSEANQFIKYHITIELFACHIEPILLQKKQAICCNAL